MEPVEGVGAGARERLRIGSPNSGGGHYLSVPGVYGYNNQYGARLETLNEGARLPPCLL
jgi:hypothetical protein